MALTHFASGSIISVLPLGTKLHTTLTHTILKAPQLELIRIVLPAGKDMHEHKAPGEITVQCIEGCFEFRALTRVLTLAPGDLVHLQGNVLHALKAIEDSSILLTIRLNTSKVL
jgi:quercetin dioxygenase-like cupin family protein